ncbi:MAG: DUF5591 domain-containing protein [Methanosarcinales archaeon]|nr:DUF5591 domain-containing protein [Methanosarcinales archaeon]
MIIPPSERSDEPLEGEGIITHPDIVRANEWIISDYEAPVRDIAIFVPCARKKPYHESPSHRIFDKVIFSILKKEDVHIVTFGTCGITPRELDTEYPFMDYSFMMGKCNVASVKREFHRLESQRICRYLTKTKDNYKQRIAYCIGDFRAAMIEGSKMAGVDVVVVPEDDSIAKCLRPDKKFIYGSLNQNEYLQDFCDAICDAKGIAHCKVEGAGGEVVIDHDWYVL